MHKGVAETAVVGCNDDVTGQAVHAFVTMKPEFDANTNETDLAKELVLQVRKVIGPFAAPKKIVSTPFPVTHSLPLLVCPVFLVVCVYTTYEWGG